MVDEVRRPVGRGDLELLDRRCDCGHRGAEHLAELHGGQPDAASGTEHDQFLARLQPSDRAEDVVRRAVRHTEGGGDVHLHPGRDPTERVGGHDGLLGEGAHERRPDHQVAERRSRRTPSPTSSTTPASSLPGTNGVGHADLVLVGDEQHVGKVDRRRVDPNPHLSRGDRR